MQEEAELTTTDQSKAVIALASRLGDSDRPSLPPTEWDTFAAAMRDQEVDLAEVFDDSFDARTLPEITEKIASKIDMLLETAGAATVEAADLKRYGISTVTIVDHSYPDAFRERLGNLAPPIIYTVGNLDLLTGDGVGIVGSRNVTEAGKAAAEEIAREAVRAGRSVVSGGARGVDSFAMNAAFMAGGTVIGVLADSLQARIRKPGTLQAIDEGTVCLLSQQVPSAGFTLAAAMGRNKLVYALSEVTVVIATDLKSGGTWSGATEALKKGNGRVRAWTGEGSGPGNSALLGVGASALATPGHLLDPTAPTGQLGLLDST